MKKTVTSLQQLIFILFSFLIFMLPVSSIAQTVAFDNGVYTLAGSTFGFADGTGGAAKMGAPRDLALDASGNVYVADADNHRIRKITPAGVVTTFAGNGVQDFVNGTGTAASFDDPIALELDAAGNIYVADRQNHSIRKITPAGVVTTLAGTGSAGYVDGVGTIAQFDWPYDLEIDATGIIYVADKSPYLRKVTTAGVVSSVTGIDVASNFIFDADKNIYTTDMYQNKILKITPAGTTTTYAGTGAIGEINGDVSVATFYYPLGLHFDNGGNLLVTDVYNDKIRQISSAGQVTDFAGSGIPGSGNSSSLTGAQFDEPYELAIAPSGLIYVADYGNHVIRKIVPLQLTTFTTEFGSASASQIIFVRGTALTANLVVTAPAGYEISLSPTSGYAASVSFAPTSGTVTTKPAYIRLASTAPVGTNNGNVTITSTGATNKTLAVTGIVTKANQTITFNALASKTIGDPAFTLAATSTSGLTVSYTSSDPAVATISGNTVTIVGTGTTTITATQAGNTNYNAATPVVQSLFVDKVEKVMFEMGMVSTFAGSGVAGYAEGTGTSAQFKNPVGITGDNAGNIYVADQQNNKIRKITPEGVTSTVAGSTAGYVNGIGTAAKFNWPTGLRMDGSGNLYVADQNTHTIRKVAPDGTVTTLAGNGTSGATNGTGTAAKFTYPRAVALDGAGNVYVTDQGNLFIRKITPAGVTTTFAGNGSTGSTNGNASSSSFNGPFGITLDTDNNVYVSEEMNHRIRKISGGVVSTLAGSTAGYVNGNGTAAKFNNPYGIYAPGDGSIYVADGLNQRIRKTTLTGEVTYIAGNGTYGYQEGALMDAQFRTPSDVFVNMYNFIFVSDQNNHRIRRITPTAFTPLVTTTGTPSAVQAFPVSGTSLTTEMLLTAPAGFEISLSAVGGFSNSLTFTPVSGNVTSTMIYIRLSATATAGVYNGNLVLESGNAYTKTFPVNGTVNGKQSQTISFDALPDKTYGDTDFDLTATASSGLAVVYTSSNLGVATVSGNTITIVGAGTTTITASQPGNSSYDAAPEVTQDLTVLKSNQTITFNALDEKNVGDPDFILTAVASSGLPVYYTSSDPSVAIIDGTTVKIVGEGTTNITALQDGNADYNGAFVVQQLVVNPSVVNGIHTTILAESAVYPNPSNDFVSITCADKIAGEITLKIRSAEGKIVYVQSFADKNELANIDISDLQSGIYLIEIVNLNNLMYQKFIKE